MDYVNLEESDGWLTAMPAPTPQNPSKSRIHLSAPDITNIERDALLGAFDSNWADPVGKATTRLENTLCHVAGVDAAVALTSASAGLHLALLTLGVTPGDTVIVPSLSLAATANAVRYVGATPVFVDSDPTTGNIDVQLLETALRGMANSHRAPAAVIADDLYGSCANYVQIEDLCNRYHVPLIENASESIGASHDGRPAGSFGALGVFNFGQSNIVTSGGGGALVGSRPMIERARHLAEQGRVKALHLEHDEVGYSYRLPNLLAAVAGAQLDRLMEMMARTRVINQRYADVFSKVPGVTLLDIDHDGYGNGYMSVIQLDQERHLSPTQICKRMARNNIETRPARKPMHLQDMYKDEVMIGGAMSEAHFAEGLLLPSGPSLTEPELQRVIASLLRAINGTPDPQPAAVIELDPEVDVRTARPLQHQDSPLPIRKVA